MRYRGLILGRVGRFDVCTLTKGYMDAVFGIVDWGNV